MSELSGLELRKAACEALGFHFEELKDDSGPVPSRLYVVRPDGSRYGSYNADFYRDGFNRIQFYPAIESDPAVSEPMFLAWLCEFNKKHPRTYICIELYADESCGLQLLEQDTGDDLINADGHTLSEARARAIVAAKEKR